MHLQAFLDFETLHEQNVNHLASLSWAPCEVFLCPWCLKGLVPPLEQPLKDGFPVGFVYGRFFQYFKIVSSALAEYG